MKFILDANTLIYLARTNLLDFMQGHFGGALYTDTHVFEETIKNAPEDKPDSKLIQDFLITNHIPIISTEIETALKIFHDGGEASCFSLATDSDIVVTNDRKAINRFKKMKIDTVSLDDLIYAEYASKALSEQKTYLYLTKLEKVYAITPTQLLFYYHKIFGEPI